MKLDPFEMTPNDIRSHREHLGLTQADAARLLGYGSKSRIAELEAGTRKPSKAVARLMAAYLQGYRPRDWPDQPHKVTIKATARQEPLRAARLPPSEDAVAKVIAAQRGGARKAGDIARQTRLGLLTVQECLDEIERRRAAAPAKAPRKARLRKGRDLDIYPEG